MFILSTTDTFIEKRTSNLKKNDFSTRVCSDKMILE